MGGLSSPEDIQDSSQESMVDGTIPLKWIQDIKDGYIEDPWFSELLPQLTSGDPEMTKSGGTRKRCMNLSMDKDGLIWNTNMKGTRRLAIPVGKVRKAMLEGIHAELGHPSAQQLCDDISDCYFIPDIFRDARAMVDACLSSGGQAHQGHCLLHCVVLGVQSAVPAPVPLHASCVPSR